MQLAKHRASLIAAVSRDRECIRPYQALQSSRKQLGAAAACAKRGATDQQAVPFQQLCLLRCSRLNISHVVHKANRSASGRKINLAADPLQAILLCGPTLQLADWQADRLLSSEGVQGATEQLCLEGALNCT